MRSLNLRVDGSIPSRLTTPHFVRSGLAPMLPASRRRPSASPNMLDSIAAHHSVRRPNLRASLLRHRLPSKVHAELKRLLRAEADDELRGHRFAQ